MKQFGITLAAIFVMCAVFFTGYTLKQPKQQSQEQVSFGSVDKSSEYHATTTLATTLGQNLVASGQGTFGSVIINVLGAGSTVFYDTTTTNINLRTGQIATTSLNILGVVAASQANGTYTYDEIYYNGIMAVYNGAQGTSTITYR